MKSRHAAALALVGWYLLVPNVHLPDLPLNRWSQWDSYDTAKECSEGRSKAREMVQRKDYKGLGDGFSVEDDRTAIDRSKCIASDDPRLNQPADNK